MKAATPPDDSDPLPPESSSHISTPYSGATVPQPHTPDTPGASQPRSLAHRPILSDWLPEAHAIARATVRHRRTVLAVAGLYTLMCLFYIGVTLTGGRQSGLGTWTGLIIDLPIHAGGAIGGFLRLRKYGRRSADAVRWFTIFGCIALVAFSVGDLVWLVYNLQGIALPYPSAADIFYVCSSIVSIVAILTFYWALGTHLSAELSKFAELLGAAWVILAAFYTFFAAEQIKTIHVKPIEIALDFGYPFVSALACTLLGSLLFGPQLQRMTWRWRWFLGTLYVAWLINFIGDIAYTTTVSDQLGIVSRSSGASYYDGGLVDFIHSTAEFMLAAALALIPLRTHIILESRGRAGAQTGHVHAPPATHRQVPE